MCTEFVKIQLWFTLAGWGGVLIIIEIMKQTQRNETNIKLSRTRTFPDANSIETLRKLSCLRYTK